MSPVSQLDPVLEQVVGLADTFAHDFIDVMGQATSLTELQRALSGTLLAFLDKVVTVTVNE